MNIEQKTLGECGCCGKKMNLATAKAAEMAISGRWYAEGKMPDSEKSQGFFDIGAGCYRAKVKKT